MGGGCIVHFDAGVNWTTALVDDSHSSPLTVPAVLAVLWIATAVGAVFIYTAFTMKHTYRPDGLECVVKFIDWFNQCTVYLSTNNTSVHRLNQPMNLTTQPCRCHWLYSFIRLSWPSIAIRWPRLRGLGLLPVNTFLAFYLMVKCNVIHVYSPLWTPRILNHVNINSVN